MVDGIYCQDCGMELMYEPKKGYVHRIGGGHYGLKCKRCGWKGAPAGELIKGRELLGCATGVPIHEEEEEHEC